MSLPSRGQVFSKKRNKQNKITTSPISKIVKCGFEQTATQSCYSNSFVYHIVLLEAKNKGASFSFILLLRRSVNPPTLQGLPKHTTAGHRGQTRPTNFHSPRATSQVEVGGDLPHATSQGGVGGLSGGNKRIRQSRSFERGDR